MAVSIRALFFRKGRRFTGAEAAPFVVSIRALFFRKGRPSTRVPAALLWVSIRALFFRKGRREHAWTVKFPGVSIRALFFRKGRRRYRNRLRTRHRFNPRPFLSKRATSPDRGRYGLRVFQSAPFSFEKGDPADAPGGSHRRFQSAPFSFEKGDPACELSGHVTAVSIRALFFRKGRRLLWGLGQSPWGFNPRPFLSKRATLAAWIWRIMSRFQSAPFSFEKGDPIQRRILREQQVSIRALFFRKGRLTGLRMPPVARTFQSAPFSFEKGDSVWGAPSSSAGVSIRALFFRKGRPWTALPAVPVSSVSIRALFFRKGRREQACRREDSGVSIRALFFRKGRPLLPGVTIKRSSFNPRPFLSKRATTKKDRTPMAMWFQSAPFSFEKGDLHRRWAWRLG